LDWGFYMRLILHSNARFVRFSQLDAFQTRRKSLATTLAAAFFLLAGSGNAQAQTASVNWTSVHQVIDGFGASNENMGASASSANQSLLFGTGSGQLGLSLLRVGVTDGSQEPGDCTSVSASCAGIYVSDMQAVTANGGKVIASPWSPPAAYKTNGSSNCTGGGGNGQLATTNYGSYATWMANFVKSLQTESGITLYAISIQNEPDQCQSYDSALWSAADIDTFVTTNLGPTFASAGLSTLIFVPEGGNYSATTNLGAACGADSSCTNYVGGFNWHDYGASLSGANTVAANPYPSGWTGGKKYWETEASCGSGFGPNFCQSGINTNMTDALDWAAVVDQRIAVDGANAWLYWWLIGWGGDDEGLTGGGTTVAKRAYMLGQYSKFVRPGYYRIDATHLPQSGVSVSAYQNTGTNTLVIIATNYTGSDVSQTFNLTNAPTFSTLTPTTTSASLSLAAQSNVTVSGNSFTYTLPADSITTFVGSSSLPPAPTNLSGTVVQ
jgi:glucuronoarabinoxylan endo-1,4-beta-xylanase